MAFKSEKNLTQQDGKKERPVEAKKIEHVGGRI